MPIPDFIWANVPLPEAVKMTGSQAVKLKIWLPQNEGITSRQNDGNIYHRTSSLNFFNELLLELSFLLSRRNDILNLLRKSKLQRITTETVDLKGYSVDPALTCFPERIQDRNMTLQHDTSGHRAIMLRESEVTMSWFHRNMFRQPLAKADRNPPMQNGHSDAFKEAHRRTMAHDSNLNSFGVKSMTDDEYKIRFASNLADVHAERKTQKPYVNFGENTGGPRDDGAGKDEGKNPALRSTAPGPRDDGSGVTATDTPAKSRQPIQPPSNAKNGRVHKQAVAGPLDLANPFQIATRIVRRSR